MSIMCQYHVFSNEENSTHIQKLNDFLRVMQEPHPIAVQEIEKLYLTLEDATSGRFSSVRYLITYMY